MGPPLELKLRLAFPGDDDVDAAAGIAAVAEGGATGDALDPGPGALPSTSGPGLGRGAIPAAPRCLLALALPRPLPLALALALAASPRAAATDAAAADLAEGVPPPPAEEEEGLRVVDPAPRSADLLTPSPINERR